MNTLVVRPDRLGDVILSTPVFEVLHRQRPESKITVLVRDNVVPLLKGLPSVSSCLTFDPSGRHKGVQGFLTLVSEVKEGGFDEAVVLQSHPRIAAALFLARIPIRIGPYSKIHSFLFYNQGLRQHRSRVEMHEADYNLQLLEKLGIQTPSRQVATSVFVNSSALTAARNWLTERGWQHAQQKWVAVHPGMGGSALNWPEENYICLISELIKQGLGVLVTTGPAESALSQRIEQKIQKGNSKTVLFYRAQARESVEFLAGLYSQMNLVVAPSTGPLHLAVALGRPVLSFYPTLKVQSVKRWGPYLGDAKRAIVLEPSVDCESDSDCMETLTLQDALAACQRLLSLSLN